MKKKLLPLFLIVILVLLFTACDAELNADADEYVGQNYKEVVADLNDAGFDDIKLTEIKDLTSDSSMDDGYVESVSIGGEDNFKKGDSFPDDSKVIIKYHIIKKIASPVGAKEVKNMDFNDIYNLFSEEGFENIDVTEKYDLNPDKSNDKSVNEITINDNSSFEKSDKFPFDAKVLITCHYPYRFFDATIKVNFLPNLVFSKYDVVFSVDGKKIGQHKHGESWKDELRLREGERTITFTNTEDSAVLGKMKLKIDNDLEAKYTISCHDDRIDVEEEYVDREIELKEGQIKTNCSASGYVNKKYKKVINSLKKQGFENIVAKPSYEAIFESSNDDTISVSINGKADFRRGDVFNKSDKIKIKYKRLVSDDPNNKEEKSSREDKKTVYITAKNNKDFAKLISVEDDKISKSFCRKYQGKKIKFKGSIDYIDNYKDYDTRFNVLLSAWDYNAESQKGPTFKFENIGAFELDDGIGVGDNVIIKATINSFNGDTGIIYLNPIKVKKR